MSKLIRIGIVGAGFGSSFYFHLHPSCHVEAVCAQFENERVKLAETYKCKKTYTSLHEVLKDPSVDAVALFTPVPLHAEHSISALNAGKHVLCAVPAGMTIEECQKVKHAVLRSGKTYMMAETSVFRQSTISARNFYERGFFGKIIAAESDYHHPGLEHYFFDQKGQPTWRHGLPPMKYSSHCISFLLGVTGGYLTSVSSQGWGDADPVLKNNGYNNTFWNETALFRTHENTPFKVSVSWRGALLPCERCVWYGERMSFHSGTTSGSDPFIVKSSKRQGADDGGFVTSDPILEPYIQRLWWQSDMLPEALRIDSGHGGSHTFLTHEFIDSIACDRKPKIGIEEAIAYTVPGIVAHQSSIRNGETLTIPTYGSL